MKYVFAGDSWALKGFTNENYAYGNHDPMEGDVRLADHWGIPYDYVLAPGTGNIALLNKLLAKKLDPTVPIIWVYTEPGRDYKLLTGNPEFEWIEREDIFDLRSQLNRDTLIKIRQRLPNPIALIGGLSDIDESLATELGFTVLCPSWQKWIADRLDSQHFKFGWGACDIGWRADYNNVRPSKTALFAWDEQIKEWCWWEEHGHFCHEHPTPLSNKEFAEYLQPTVEEWLNEQR